MTDLAWLEWRRSGIGGSDVARAASGKYGGMYAVVADKLGLTPPTEETAAMQRGHRWEQPIADAVLSLVGLHVVGEQTWCEYQGDARHRCTVDGFLAPTAEATADDLAGGLEIKTHGRNVRPAWDYYIAQCQWLMHVTGLPMVLLVVAEIDDSDDTLTGIALRRIERDDLAIDTLVMLADRILEHVAAGTLPDPDNAEALALVAQVNATADSTAPAVELPDEWADRLARIKEAEAEASAVEDWVKEQKAMLRHLLGSATLAVANGWQVKVGEPAKILTDESSAKLLAERPDLGVIVLDRAKADTEPGLIDSYRTATGARRLTITALKGTRK